MKATKKLLIIISATLALVEWQLCAQDKSLPVVPSYTTDSQLAEKSKTGFVEYTNANPPKISYYLHQIVQADGDLSDTNHSDSFGLFNDASWDPDLEFLQSSTTGSRDADYPGQRWDHFEYSNTNGMIENNSVVLTSQNYGSPDISTNGPYYDVAWAYCPGGINNFSDTYWDGGNFQPMAGSAEFMTGDNISNGNGLHQELTGQTKTSESYSDTWTSEPQYHTVDYNLDDEYTTDMLKEKTLSKLNLVTNNNGAGVAEIYLAPDEVTLKLGKATYDITTGTLATNQIYVLYEQLTAKTNGAVYKRYKRFCPIVTSNSTFSDKLSIEISPALAFKVNGKELLGQIGTNDTTLGLTKVQLWRIGDFDPNGPPCEGGCGSCEFTPETNQPPGMPKWSVSEPSISLRVKDTPVTYKTSLGTPMSFAVNYDQHDPRMSGTAIPANGWNNSWCSYVHIIGDVATNGSVNFGQWTGYLFSEGGGVSVYDYTNGIDPYTYEGLKPLNGSSPISGGTNYGANGFRLMGSDGSQKIFGLVTPVYSTVDEDGLNGVDRLAQAGKLPSSLSIMLFLSRMNHLAGGWSYSIGFEEEDEDTNSTSGGFGGSSGGGGGMGGGSSGFALTKGWAPMPVTGFAAYENEADALLTESIDRYGNRTRFFYDTVTSGGKTNYLLKYVVDCDNKTNVISYNGDNQITNVATPYGQSAGFTYTDGQLSSITDAQGMTSSLTYDEDTGLMKTMTTPYGTNSFKIWDPGSVVQEGFSFGTAQGTNAISRAILVTQPNGSHQLYAYRYDSYNVGVPGQYSPSPATDTPIGTIDDGSTYGSDSDAAFYLRNSFHWGPKQCEQLSTLTNLQELTSQDYLLATMSHWLVGRYAGSTAGGMLSAVVQGSPDGVNAGAVTWYDYGNKITPYQLDGAPLNRVLVAQTFPDTGTRYSDVVMAGGLPTSETTTYTLPDGSVGTRTYTAQYTNVAMSQTFTLGGSTVSSGAWTFPELLKITGPQGETRLSLSSPDSTQTIIHTNYGVVSTMQIPERLTLSVINAITNTSLIYFNSRGQVTGKSRNGLNTSITFDSNGFLKQIVDAEIQRTNSYAFTNGQLAAATSPLGLVTRYSWDKLGRLTGVNYPDSTSISNVYTRLDVTGQKDRLGNWTHAAYDSMRHRLSSTDRNGKTTTFTYCDCGALESVTDPLNFTTTYATDFNGRVTNITDVTSGRSYAATRNLFGQITKIADNAEDSYSGYFYQYNNQGLATNVTHGYGSPLYQASYDIYDRPVFLTDANGVGMTNAYDPLGRVLTRAFPNGGVETSIYSSLGLIKRYDLNDELTSYGYDVAGRLTAMTNANLEITRYGYDAAGDLLTLVDGRNNTTTWTYDQYRRATKKTDANNVVVWTNGFNANGWVVNSWTPAKGLVAYSYDNNGNATNLTMANSSLSRVYDALNRPTQINFGNIRLTRAYTGFGAFKGGLSSETAQPISSGVDSDDAARSVSYGYQTELLSSETRPDQTVYYHYDVLGRLLGVTNNTGTFVYTYNDGGNLVQSLTYPSGYSSRSYNAMGEVTNISTWLNGQQNAVTYDYDLNGNRLHVFRAKNLAYDGIDSSVTYGYDPAGQLTSALGHEADNTARLNEKFTYGYDKSGNLAARTNGVLVQAFVSDPANELTNITRNTSLTFDGNGTTNLASVTVNGQSTAIYNDQTFATTSGLSLANGSNSFTVVAVDTSGNGVTNVFSASLPVTQRLSYDANGNLTSDGTRGFDYDDLNQLVRVTTTNLWKTEYDYDGQLRHHARRDYQWRNGGWQLANKCYYVYAGWNVVQEVNTVAPTVSYTHGLELLERDSTATNQSALFYQTDGNGNVTLLFDMNQQVQARYLYDAYGNLLAKSGTLADVNRYRFSGKEYDLHSGLYYYGYRFYEPNLQRWMNRDPIEEAGGINLYQFVGNNPINYYDLFGLLDYYNSKGGFTQPSGPVPYMEGDTWYGNLGAQVYNTIPFAYNGLFGWASDIGKGEGDAYNNKSTLGMIAAVGNDAIGFIPGEGALAKKCQWIRAEDFAKDLKAQALDYFKKIAANLETGQHGEVYKKAGNYLIQFANQNKNILLPEIFEDLKTQGRRLIEYGNSVSHK